MKKKLDNANTDIRQVEDMLSRMGEKGSPPAVRQVWQRRPGIPRCVPEDPARDLDISRAELDETVKRLIPLRIPLLQM